MKKTLSYISLVTTAFYAVTNLFSLFLMNRFEWDRIAGVTEFTLGIDVYSWHIYGIFAVVAFVIKLCDLLNGEKNKWMYINITLHFLFMSLSFIGIYYMFQNCF